MGLRLNVSHSLGALSVSLAKDLKARQQHHVFLRHTIVTQTQGMNSWLKIRMADQLGITAGCDFLKPNELIQQLFQVLGGKYHGVLSKENLTWLLFGIFGETQFIQRFPDVSCYYQNGGYDKDLKRLTLAEKIADLFDQYQIYRSEMICQWNLAKEDEIPGSEWQQYLWVRAKTISFDKLPDKTAQGQYIKKSLANTAHQTSLTDRMPAIHIFGLSIITEYHLEILQEAAKYTDVIFYFLNPAPEVYWFEDRSEKQLALYRKKGYELSFLSTGNPLLSGWGKVIQDMFSLLFKHDDFLNTYNDVSWAGPGNHTLLGCIQGDIYLNSATAERNQLNQALLSDGSLMISSCYTISREVEALYNYLVHLVDLRKEKLSPRDIVVMVTDIDAYAPYIRAVFDNTPYKFRFTIADESYTSGDTISGALKAVLAISRQNFKAEDVLQLLDFSYIKKRFGLYDVGTIRKAVAMAGIRFGMEGSKEDDTAYVSWANGIKRMMYGICISGGEAYELDEDIIYPLDILEGASTIQLIRFCHFAEVLMDSINSRDKPRSISDWGSFTKNVIHNLVYDPDEEAEEDYTLLIRKLDNLNTLNALFKEKVSYEVFSHSFVNSITEESRSGSFAGAGITFCSLIPMRSIPFKVVALMGLNYDKFPRKEQVSGFSLMEINKRKGDRNVKENDKHLLLETLLSAKDYLYLSYIGQSPKDNSVIPPSALLDELFDYIADGLKEDAAAVRNLLVTKHPLHSFSQKYASHSPGLFAYLDDSEAASAIPLTTIKEKPALNFGTVSLDSFCSFFKNPFRTYYNKALGIAYNEEQVLLQETEIFDLNSLQEWAIKNQLLILEEDAAENLREKLIRTGGLPLKNMSVVAMQKIEAAVSPVRVLFKECTGDAKSEPVNIEVKLGGTVLQGTLGQVYNNKLVSVCYSKKENKYILETTIRYLAAAAAASSLAVSHISAMRDEVFEGAVIGQQEAISMLEELLKIYKAGHERIVAFYPDFKVAPAAIPGLDQGEFEKIVADCLEGYFPSTDTYILNEYYNDFFGSDGILEEYKQNCNVIWGPVASIFPNFYN